MDTKLLVSQFLDKNYTKTQTQRRLRVLRDFLNWRLFEKSEKMSINDAAKEFAKSKLALQDPKNYHLDEEFLRSLGEGFFDQFDSRNMTTKLAELEKGVSGTKQVTLYLAFDPPADEIDRFGQWIKQNLGAEALLDIHHKSALIGGAAISYQGVVKDYSIKARIDSQRKEIVQTLLGFRK